MSVAKNSFGLAPYYQWTSYEVQSRGLDLVEVRACTASPTKAVAFGRTTANNGATLTNSGATSTNGIDWTVISTAPNTVIHSVAYGNSVFVAVGAAGTIYTSPGTDGATWTARTKAGSYVTDFYGVKFSGGIFWAMQQNGNIQRSTDGITWTEIASATLNFASDIDADQPDGPFQYSVVHDDGLYIHFTGRTMTTANHRIAITTASSTTLQSVSTTITVKHGRDDIGDGLGPLVQSYVNGYGTANAGSIIVRGIGRHINANYSTAAASDVVDKIIASDRLGRMPLPLGNTEISGTYLTTNIQGRINVLYSDGWYNIIYPGIIPARSTTVGYPSQVAGYNYPTGINAIFSLNIREDDFGAQFTPEFKHQYQPRILLPHAGLTTRADNVALAKSIPFTLNGDNFLVVGSYYGLSGYDGGTYIMKAKRAFRKLNTTIDY